MSKAKCPKRYHIDDPWVAEWANRVLDSFLATLRRVDDPPFEWESNLVVVVRHDHHGFEGYLADTQGTMSAKQMGLAQYEERLGQLDRLTVETCSRLARGAHWHEALAAFRKELSAHVYPSALCTQTREELQSALRFAAAQGDDSWFVSGKDHIYRIETVFESW